MTNLIAPFGFQDVSRLQGSSPQMGLTKVLIGSSDPTPIFNGDLVVTSDVTLVSGNFGEVVTQGSSVSAPAAGYRGVFRGCEYLNTAVGRVVWSPFWPGGPQAADAIAYIADDPEMLFIAQASSAQAVITPASIGFNIAVAGNSSNGNTLTGQSALSVSAPASTNTLPFRIMDFYSNYVPPGGFVNGTDNTNPGQILVLAPNNFTRNQLTGQ